MPDQSPTTQPTQAPEVAPTQQPQTAPTPPSGVVYASFLRRFAAALLDGIIIGIISAPIMLIFGFATSSSLSATGTSSSVISSTSNLISMLLSFGYYVFLIGYKGQTIGKMALGIKVVNLNNTQTHPDYVHAFLREIVGKLISAAVLLLGYIWVIFDKNKQAWHDKIAGTVVIKL